MKRALSIALIVTSAIAFSNDSNCIAQSSSRSSGRTITPSRNRAPVQSRSTYSPANGRKRSASNGFAFFELFTSEGCSSCPPADENLARINELARKNPRIFALSYHVDYWNRLGWKDPYSDSKHSKRQRAYANAFESSRVYTPQMVINGSAEFNGSNQRASDKAVNIAMQLNPTAEIAINSTVSKQGIHIAWNTRGIDPNDVINLALVQNEGRQSITNGENANRNLRHINIVREFETVEGQKPRGRLTMEIPSNFDPDEFHIVGFIQSNKTGAIKNATRSRIESS